MSANDEDDDDEDDDEDDDDQIDWAAAFPTFTAAGGATTVSNFTSLGLIQPAANLAGAALTEHMNGKAVFQRTFTLHEVAPLWNNVRCESCHLGGGRAGLPRVNATTGVLTPQLLFRVSVPGVTGPHGEPMPVPGFGDQIQPLKVVEGVDAQDDVRGASDEGNFIVRYTEQPSLRFKDGTSVSLRRPTYTFVKTTRDLPAGTLVSPRTGSQVTGLGLLEAVPEATILAFARNNTNNGVSGRPNRVWDEELGMTRLGRFGWKANQPSLRQQNAGAANGDMGITTTVFPIEPGETAVSGLPNMSDQELKDLTVFTQTMGVPAIRNNNSPEAQLGAQLFVKAECTSCHVPAMRTGTLPGRPEVSNQLIAPFTDLLLHDMGPDLADNRPDFLATGREWRTAPLWGLSLQQTVHGHTNLLHDGRARNVLEAIMWHGGEGANSRKIVTEMSKQERDALLSFLNSI
ncbi:di-heme oxidoreductase family protein [Hymenobacter weizhouensis]|uniref:di-heme oxidoreductase family protein n=1 Tax=Hymenobacter sp. YIM 151500-1 TaxID=2987689 RepID=UPI002227A510|nr:di-heme oxidoredictase family protein [Hymenobacter sp. YIM 151500-1]UYZ64715.1 c-type cytochrome [Hymenobacter sp. YIM 151500-1]